MQFFNMLDLFRGAAVIDLIHSCFFAIDYAAGALVESSDVCLKPLYPYIDRRGLSAHTESVTSTLFISHEMILTLKMISPTET